MSYKSQKANLFYTSGPNKTQFKHSLTPENPFKNLTVSALRWCKPWKVVIAFDFYAPF